jgi:hypothetical protein
MTNEHLINSLLTEVLTGKISCRQSLQMAFGAGFDKGRYYNYGEINKAVEQYDKNGKLLKTYPSIRDAERKLSIKRQTIIACCKNKQHSAGGFHWYGGDDRLALMRELKMLRSDIEYKALLKARKIVSPLFNISKLK